MNRKRHLQNSIKGVTPAKAGVQKLLKRLDSRFRGNDKLGLLQLARKQCVHPDITRVLVMNY